MNYDRDGTIREYSLGWILSRTQSPSLIHRYHLARLSILATSCDQSASGVVAAPSCFADAPSHAEGVVRHFDAAT